MESWIKKDYRFVLSEKTYLNMNCNYLYFGTVTNSVLFTADLVYIFFKIKINQEKHIDTGGLFGADNQYYFVTNFL